MTQINLMRLKGLQEASIISRPSKICKTPYVADALLLDSQEQIIAHSASLGCCGLADSGAHVLVSKSNGNGQCSHRIFLSIHKELEKEKEEIIGIYPKLAEELAEFALRKNGIPCLQNVQKYRRELAIFVEDKVDSRFDFAGLDKDGVPFLMEIKNVPLADYEDIGSKERKKRTYESWDFCSKVAYFPDGYRKKATDPVSPRALKHIRELSLIKKESKTRCILCFVIQRTDIQCFQPSILDPEYKSALEEAIETGVEVVLLVVKWTRAGDAYLWKCVCLPKDVVFPYYFE